MKHLQRGALAAAALMASAAVAQAGILRVSEAGFTAAAGLITFSEFSLGTVNPTYAPGDYGGGVGAPTVDFDGYFVGQSLSATPAVDCPGAAATACVVGSPTGPLTLDAAAPDVSIVSDGANPTSPVLSGSPTFNGPIAVLFSTDQYGVGFDAGFFDDVGSTAITAFDRSGNLLGSVSNEGTGIEFLGLINDNPTAVIAGVFLDLIGAESAGFAIDNLRFGVVGEVVETSDVPVPAALPLLAVSLAGFGLLRRRAA